MVPAILAIDQRLHSGQRVVATICRERRKKIRSFVVSGNTKLNIHHHPSQEHESIGYSRFFDPHIGMDFQDVVASFPEWFVDLSFAARSKDRLAHLLQAGSQHFLVSRCCDFNLGWGFNQLLQI